MHKIAYQTISWFINEWKDNIFTDLSSEDVVVVQLEVKEDDDVEEVEEGEVLWWLLLLGDVGSLVDGVLLQSER